MLTTFDTLAMDEAFTDCLSNNQYVKTGSVTARCTDPGMEGEPEDVFSGDDEVEIEAP